MTSAPATTFDSTREAFVGSDRGEAASLGRHPWAELTEKPVYKSDQAQLAVRALIRARLQRDAPLQRGDPRPL